MGSITGRAPSDPDFVGALLSTPDDVELVPEWRGWLPFDSLAVSLLEPLRVHDGERWCTYLGFIVCGIRQGPRTGLERRPSSPEFPSDVPGVGSTPVRPCTG